MRVGLNKIAKVFLMACCGIASMQAVAAVTPLQPGINKVTAYPVAPTEVDRVIRLRQTTSSSLSTASTPDTSVMSLASASLSAPTGPASITELARALKNDPDLIYEYVRNNIDFYPIWGVQKGAVGTILDNAGTAFDQASLMVSLLRQAGYTASYVIGTINLTGAQLSDWVGIDANDACATINVLGSGGMWVSQTVPAVTCPASTATALTSLKMWHIWVKVMIGGAAYYFDPSFKPYESRAGIDLVAATGYNAADYLSVAKQNATITANYVHNLCNSCAKSRLDTYSITLGDYLRANKPAAVLEDVIGGRVVIPRAGGNLRQTVLPYQDTTAPSIEWTSDIPADFRPTLRLRYLGIDRTFTSDEIYGKRLSITYNATNQPVLMLDGVVQATGDATTLGSSSDVTFNIRHPAYLTPEYASEDRVQSIKAGQGYTYLIGNGWGPMGRGYIEKHRAALVESKASGAVDTSEVALGSSLAMLSGTWISQYQRQAEMVNSLAGVVRFDHHNVGIAGFNGSFYVDLPANTYSSVGKNSQSKLLGADLSTAYHMSILESTAVHQLTGVSGVSASKLIDMAISNNVRIYDAKSSNYTSEVQPNLTACTSANLAAFQSAVSAGRRLMLPARCDITEASWRGVGYYDMSVVNGELISMGAIINGGFQALGGFATSPQPASVAVPKMVNNSISPNIATQNTGSHFGDPIDMVKGHYLYSRNDITTGVGEFPMSLHFERLYSSGMRTQSGSMGKGWTHNLAPSVRVGTDGFQGLGEDSALDAVHSILEAMVSIDLLNDAVLPFDKMVIANIGPSWLAEKLVNNTLIITQGLNAEVFVKVDNGGGRNPPPGSSGELIKWTSSDGSFTYEYKTLNKASLVFDSQGKITTYTHPNGVQAKYAYSGNNLTSVTNSLGRSLTFTNTSGRITRVADGTRNVNYAYDTTTGNLRSFTDATSKVTTFQYDLPGRMTKLFYPSFPTIAFLTNVYDTLGRVQTQTNANGNLYSYYFAGSRSEEVGPGGVSRVSYLNGSGKVIKEIDPLGRVTTNAYDGQTRLVRKTLPEGNSVEYVYDDATCVRILRSCTHNIKTVRQVPKPSSGLGVLTTTMTYESDFNRVSTSTDARGNVTTYSYNDRGLPLTISGPADNNGVSPMTTFGYVRYFVTGFHWFYLQNSETKKISSTASVTDTVTYNTSNKYVPATKVVDSGTGKLNLTTTYTYDAFGNLSQENGPRTDVTDTTSYAYDAERRVTQVTNALGKMTRMGYDADGRIVRSAAQIGTQWMVSCKTYTNTGKELKAWGPSTTALDTTCPTAAAPVPVTDYAYDTLDRLYRTTENLTASEGGNRVTETVYNADDSVAKVKRAVGTSIGQDYVVSTYTANGQLATVSDAKNNRTIYEYDGHDRKVKTRFPSRDVVELIENYSYDDNGNLLSKRMRNGQTISFAYDRLNRLVSRTYPVATDNVNFTYDLLNRRLSVSKGEDVNSYVYDNADRVSSATAKGKTISYLYDGAGNRTRTTYPETSFYITNSYDALNRPTQTLELGARSLSSYAYDDLSRRTGVQGRPNNSVVTTYGYSPQGALGSLEHNFSGLNYEGTNYDNKLTFTRNQMQEITNYNWTNDVYDWSRHAANTTRSYTSNGLNQYTFVAGANLRYDANGNLIGDGVWTYIYDNDNRLINANKVNHKSTLSYDPEGRLKQIVINGYVYNNVLYEGNKVIAWYTPAGDLSKRYVHDPSLDQPIMEYSWSGTSYQESLFYTDHQGSIVATSNASGSVTSPYRYGPFGEPHITSGSLFRYTGQQLLGSLNLYYYNARFYSPQLGRFLQTDPIGYADDMNLYAYVGNNPINFTDPTGLCPSCLGALIGGGIDLGIQLYSNGGQFSEVNWGSVGVSAALGAVGNVAAGRAASQFLNNASIGTKGVVGDIAASAKGFVQGRVPVSFQQRVDLSRSYTRVDQVQKNIFTGKTVLVEAKYGKSPLSSAQKRAQKELDNYQVVRTSQAEVVQASRNAGSVVGGGIGSTLK